MGTGQIHRHSFEQLTESYFDDVPESYSKRCLQQIVKEYTDMIYCEPKVNNVVLDDVNQRIELLKGFVEYVENEFDIYAYTPDIKEHINNYIKTL